MQKLALSPMCFIIIFSQYDLATGNVIHHHQISSINIGHFLPACSATFTIFHHEKSPPLAIINHH